MTKRPAPIPWRPRPVTREELKRFVEQSKRTRNEIIDRAVSQYVRDHLREG